MFNREYIIKFLNKHYQVVLSDITTSIHCLDDNNILSLYDLGKELINIFGTTEIYPWANDWFKEKRAELTKEVYDYLKQYRVKLTQFDWITIDSKGNKLEWEDIKKELVTKNYDSEKVIEMFYNEWKENEIILTSERMIDDGEI